MTAAQRFEGWARANARAAWLIALLLAVICWQEYRAFQLRAELTKERECRWSVTCQDRSAATSSWSEEYPVQSPTGRWFFQGRECKQAGCDEVKAGYRWAEQVGATKVAACAQLASELREGCLAYVEIYSDSREYEGDPPESEPPGTRWGG